jgi:hypothetical protein
MSSPTLLILGVVCGALGALLFAEVVARVLLWAAGYSNRVFFPFALRRVWRITRSVALAVLVAAGISMVLIRALLS